MAEALSAVATNASPRAVAKASWSGSPKPFAETFSADMLQTNIMMNAGVNFIKVGLGAGKSVRRLSHSRNLTHLPNMPSIAKRLRLHQSSGALRGMNILRGLEQDRARMNCHTDNSLDILRRVFGSSFGTDFTVESKCSTWVSSLQFPLSRASIIRCMASEFGFYLA